MPKLKGKTKPPVEEAEGTEEVESEAGEVKSEEKEAEGPEPQKSKEPQPKKRKTKTKATARAKAKKVKLGRTGRKTAPLLKSKAEANEARAAKALQQAKLAAEAQLQADMC